MYFVGLAEFPLGCDGVNSQVRKAMHGNYVTWNYDQMGVVATLNLSEAIDNNIAWQRFLPTGPMALLPVTPWYGLPLQIRQKNYSKFPEEHFIDEVNEALWKTYKRNPIVETATSSFDSLLRLLNCSSDSVRRYPPKISGVEENSRAAFPLGFGHATSYIGKGVALVGDAAHRIHPLAGQGVNLGFGDVTCLNKVLGEAVYAGSAINNLNYLKQYESERQKHNVPTMLAVDGLHRLYNSDFTPLVLLRSLGLQATHALNPLKAVGRCQNIWNYPVHSDDPTKKVKFDQVNISACSHAFKYARVGKANANEPERKCIGTLLMLNKEASRPILVFTVNSRPAFPPRTL
ncbi:hypothetical protein NQ317_010723 [Molorchus minor]|uniref:FAD-binding domain-containing protein n=1 Tax=Molorchus minor TaxID=1323400 RepID=A0ABQ9K6C7_9CUCU|nr:hypothetical protein NQ317_010723 [Molorchus minor]